MDSWTHEDQAKVVRPFAFFRNPSRLPNANGGPSPSSRPILVFDNVYKYFQPDVPTLRGVSLTVEAGEFVFVTGASGAGKSTLLQLVYRQHLADEGHIYFSGRDLGRLSADAVPFLRRNLGIVFQDFKVIGHWTVFENCALALEIIGLPPRVVRARVSEALERVGLAGRGGHKTGTLSGGEQQRVAIARAIVAEPSLLLADEPTGNLDPHLAIDVLTLLEEINQAGTTVLFATHDHALIHKRQHRIVSIDDGRIVEARNGLRSWGSIGTSTNQSDISQVTRSYA